MRRALDSVRPYLGSHGGDVEVLAVDGDAGVVTLRMLGSCDGCASSSVTLELAVQAAIEEAAPEITRIDVEGGADAAPSTGSAAIPVTLGRKPDPRAPAMAPIYGLRALAPGRVGPLEIEGNKLIVCRVGTAALRLPQRVPALRQRPRHGRRSTARCCAAACAARPTTCPVPGAASTATPRTSTRCRSSRTAARSASR